LPSFPTRRSSDLTILTGSRSPITLKYASLEMVGAASFGDGVALERRSYRSFRPPWRLPRLHGSCIHPTARFAISGPGLGEVIEASRAARGQLAAYELPGLGLPEMGGASRGRESRRAVDRCSYALPHQPRRTGQGERKPSPQTHRHLALRGRAAGEP